MLNQYICRMDPVQSQLGTLLGSMMEQLLWFWWRRVGQNRKVSSHWPMWWHGHRLGWIHPSWAQALFQLWEQPWVSCIKCFLLSNFQLLFRILWFIYGWQGFMISLSLLVIKILTFHLKVTWLDMFCKDLMKIWTGLIYIFVWNIIRWACSSHSQAAISYLLILKCATAYYYGLQRQC